MKPEIIRLLPEYQRFDYENPYSYMRDLEDVCNAFLSTGSPLHIICLVLFPFSLKKKAKIWFHSLTSNSISNWEDMRSVFLNKFFPPRRTNALMRAIQNFSEKPGESFATTWGRYKELLYAIPHHGLDIDQIVSYFHQGLSLYSKQYIQMMSGGQLYEKSPKENVQCFDTLAENAWNWEINTSLDATRVHSTPIVGGKHHVKENDDLQAKIATLTRKLEAIEMQKVNEVTTVPKVPSVPTRPMMEDSCIIYDDPTHLTTDCPNLPQVKGAIQIEQTNALNYLRKPFNSPYSETYNPGWSKHPNFRWKSDGGHASSGQGNLPQNPFQSNPCFPNQTFQNQNFQN